MTVAIATIAVTTALAATAFGATALIAAIVGTAMYFALVILAEAIHIDDRLQHVQRRDRSSRAGH